MSGPSPMDLRDLLVRAFDVVKAVADAHVTGSDQYKALRDDMHAALREPIAPSMSFHGPDGSAIVRVLHDLHMERRRQDEKWGGPEHDDTHEIVDWTDLIYARGQDIAALTIRPGLEVRPRLDEERRLLIQIAALAVAAVESIDRKRA